MRHLRDNRIFISGSSQKQQLINTRYFHGYKGYRFFVSSSQYDTKLKSLLYGKMMFIETALKNIALNTIMSEIDSSSIYDIIARPIPVAPPVITTVFIIITPLFIVNSDV